MYGKGFHFRHITHSAFISCFFLFCSAFLLYSLCQKLFQLNQFVFSDEFVPHRSNILPIWSSKSWRRKICLFYIRILVFRILILDTILSSISIFDMSRNSLIRIWTASTFWHRPPVGFLNFVFIFSQQCFPSIQLPHVSFRCARICRYWSFWSWR